MVEFGGESPGRFQIAGRGIEKRVCLLCGRECAVEADIGVEGGFPFFLFRKNKKSAAYRVARFRSEDLKSS